LVVGLAIEHAGMPAEDLVAEPLQGDQADGPGGVGIAVGAEQLRAEQLPQRLAAQPGALLDDAQQRPGRQAVVIDAMGRR
jgi:hypothetical protein